MKISFFLSLFKPREDKYILALFEHTQLVVLASQNFLNFSKATTREDRHKYHDMIVDLERKADALQQNIDESINHALMLPFDRSHLFRLLDASDDIIDAMRKATHDFIMYDVAITDDMMETFVIINQAVNILSESIPLLVSIPKNVEVLKKNIISVIQLETKADILRNQSYRNIFKISDNNVPIGHGLRDTITPMNLVIRDCINRVEKVANACEYMAKAFSIIVMDNA